MFPNLSTEFGNHATRHANRHHQIAFVKFNLKKSSPLWHCCDTNTERISHTISSFRKDMIELLFLIKLILIYEETQFCTKYCW